MAFKSKFMDRVGKALEEGVTAGLNTIGMNATRELKEATTVDLGRLKGSHTYALMGIQMPKYLPSIKTNPGNPNMGLVSDIKSDDDVISPVRQRFYLKVGTAVPYAVYVDKGTGAHRTSEDSEGFIQRITDWGKRKGFTRDQIAGLIKVIRHSGTHPHPFMTAAEAYIRFAAGRILKRSVGTVLKVIPPVKYEIKGGRVSKKGD